MNAEVRLVVEQTKSSGDALGGTFFRVKGENDEQVLWDSLSCL